MASASSSNLDMEGPATINFEIVNENKNNNNIQLYDLANRENDFWSQPQEEIFYIPQPLSALVGPLPFSNTLNIDGLHYMPTDADMIFGDLDSDDESLEPFETEPFEIEIVNDTPSETESTDDSELESPSRTSSLDSDTTEEPVIETVDETDMFADMRSQSRTSSLDQDITEEPVIETVDDTDIFAYYRSQSRTSSLDLEATEVYPSIEVDGTITVIEESLSAIREYEIIRDAAILMTDGRSTTDKPNDFVVRSSRWDRLPGFSDSETSLTQPVGQESRMEPLGDVMAISGTALVSDDSNQEHVSENDDDIDCNAYNTTDSSPIIISDSEEDEADYPDTSVVEEKFTPKSDEITDDSRSSLGASKSGSLGNDVCHGSVDIHILLRQALQDLNYIYHINENWEPPALLYTCAVHDSGERVDHSASGAHNPCNVDLSPVSSNRDTINRWLYQNDRQAEDDVTQYHHNSYYCNNDECIPVIEPRLSQSAVHMRTGNNKRKMEENEGEAVESKSDTFMMSRQITRAKRRRIYQNNDQGEDDITHYHHYDYYGNKEEFVPAIELRLSQSAVEMCTANRKRKLDEMDDKAKQSRSDSYLMNQQATRAKRRRN